MAVDFTMPKLGLTMTDGTIREWLVADGTSVQAGDPVLIIETDKVETEVEAREDGVLAITGLVGENYECGAVIGQLLGAGESAAPAPAPAAASPASAAAPAAAPAAAEAVVQVGAAAPVSAVGADVAARGEHDRILASPMARAAARDGGVDLAGIAGSGPGGRIVADDVGAYIARAGAVAGGATTNGSGPAADVAARGEHDRILASPMARAAARDGGVDLAGIAGSGPSGRIVADDVARFLVAQKAAATATPSVPAAPAAAATPSVPAAPDSAAATAAPVAAGGSVAATAGARMLAELLGIDLRMVPQPVGGRLSREDVAAWVRARLAEDSSGAAGPVSAAPAAEAASALMPLLQEPTTMIPLRGMRGVIAERMHASLQQMAQLTLSVDADMTAVNAERTRLKDQGLTAPGYTAWVIAAASRALVEHPYVNSQVTEDGVALLPEVHVGVAVALDDGLIVPVVQHANALPVSELHESVADLAGRARQSKLTFDELQGGTFSVTALGMYGVDMFTPVINPPNTAILGVGRLRTETRWNDGVPTPATVMTLSLTWDHRAFDGAPAAEFAQSIVRHLENPTQLTG